MVATLDFQLRFLIVVFVKRTSSQTFNNEFCFVSCVANVIGYVGRLVDCSIVFDGYFRVNAAIDQNLEQVEVFWNWDCIADVFAT